MTSIVRSPKYAARGWPVHRGPRSNISAIIEAADQEADEQADDADRLCREARERIEHERRNEAER